MDSKRILYVSQEIHPYLPENEVSKPSLQLPRKMNEKGHQVRVFMPRYGLINERRHQLHEVIRLSGINININEVDQPLIIKVASVPQARMQVYFIDNEEFFKRKAVFYDEDGNFFDDNDQRAIFFCRGVVETVKKLGWSPDIIHCHGWMASFLPLYLKKFHADDPLFAESKLVQSVYDAKDEKMPASLSETMKLDGVEGDDLKNYEGADMAGVYVAGANYCDAAVIGSENVASELQEKIKDSVDNFLEYKGEDYVDAVHELYKSLFVEEEVA